MRCACLSLTPTLPSEPCPVSVGAAAPGQTATGQTATGVARVVRFGHLEEFRRGVQSSASRHVTKETSA